MFKVTFNNYRVSAIDAVPAASVIFIYIHFTRICISFQKACISCETNNITKTKEAYELF
jgi:hypothetical protein